MIQNNVQSKAKTLLVVLGFFFVSSNYSGVISQEQSLGNQSSYREIGDMYMRSFGLDERDEQSSDEVKEGKFQPLQLTANEKRELVFTLLAQNEECNDDTIENNKLLRTALEDLEIFYAPGRDYPETVFAHLNNTRTVFGEVVLAKIIGNPQIDVESLQNRQAFIKELIEDESLFNELDGLMRKVHKAEDNILSFWKKESVPTKKAIDSLYFGKRGLKKFNQSALALEVKTRLDNVKTGLLLTGDFLFVVAAHQMFQRKMDTQCSWAESFKTVGKSTLSNFNPKSWYDSYKNIYSVETRGIIRENLHNLYSDANIKKLREENALVATMIEAQKPSSEEALEKMVSSHQRMGLRFLGFQAAFMSGYGAFKWWITKNVLSEAVQHNNTQCYLQKRLIDVATLVASVEHIQELASVHKSLQAALICLEKSNIFDESSSASSDGKKLVNLLLTNTFKGNASFFSSAGRVLAAHTLMGTAKDELVCAMEAIGELDACLSIAKLYKKHLDTPVGYNFVEYVQSDVPSMKAIGFWNPIVDPQVVVPNDLILGGDVVRNGIVTGSNTGGKSTMLKAVSISVLLAQTLGITPASEFIMTPFATLATSLNIKDDTASGQSLFKAEVNRAHQLMQALKELAPGQFAFYVIDELFTGTSPEKGQAAAIKVARAMAESEQLLYLWATHYPQLTKLEEETSNVFKNYKMEAYKDEETGKLVRPYKLEDGISISNIANDILEEECQNLFEQPNEEN